MTTTKRCTATDIFEELMDGPASVGDIALKFGRSRETVRRHVVKLVERGEVRKWRDFPDIYGVVMTNGEVR